MRPKSLYHRYWHTKHRNFSVRKHVLGYDDVMNTQRSIIYEQRNIVLDDMDVHQQILAMRTGVSLTSASTSQLIVYTTGFVALRSYNTQTAQFDNFLLFRVRFLFIACVNQPR